MTSNLSDPFFSFFSAVVAVWRFAPILGFMVACNGVQSCCGLTWIPVGTKAYKHAGYGVVWASDFFANFMQKAGFLSQVCNKI